MEDIASFQIDHERMEPGLFVSRQDKLGKELLTTFDIRVKKPNGEPPLDVPALHTTEHIGATVLRNNEEWKDRVIYFGPMGCRTGYYLILAGPRYSSVEVLDLVRWVFEEIANWNQPIPGATSKECGNYQDQNLNMAKWEARRYLQLMRNPQDINLNYPQ